MVLAPGVRLGAYEILAPIGVGGMGEVYRARDTRLGRDVALKVLPELFALDADRLARFRREAQVLAKLNHPNIAAIHGLEESNPSAPSAGSGQAAVLALVLELVEGPTLAEVIERAQGSRLTAQGPDTPQRDSVAALRPSERNSRVRAAGGGAPAAVIEVGPHGIPIKDALLIARQIADALESAHEQGVVHRDLKPANIKLKVRGAPPPCTDDGRLDRRLSAVDVADCTVKVLDFGLAKAFDPLSPAGGEGWGEGAAASQSPTITSPAATRMGLILGTAAYMAPEQARGRTVDKRADIWAFGSVLYEMLTGARAFAGEDVAETLGAVIHKEPAWAALPADTPPAVRTVLQRCLQKDPKQRVRDIGDVRLALDGAFESPTVSRATDAAVPATTAWRRSLLVGSAALLVGAIAASLAVWALMRPTPSQVVRLAAVHSGPEDLAVAVDSVVVSPDGRRIVYQTTRAGQRQLYVRALDQLTATRLGSVENVFAVFMSPDGQWVGFVDQLVNGSLKKIAITGGPVITICRLPPSTGISGASWGPDDTIIFGSGGGAGGLWRVAAAGGAPEALTKPDPQKGESRHGNPEILPGGQDVVFANVPSSNRSEDAQIEVLNLRTGERKTLIQGGNSPHYATSGHLVYEVEGTLRAVAFDLDRLAVVGNAVPVVEDVVASRFGANFSVARNGTLVYVQGATQINVKRTLVWVDRQGREEAIKVPPRAYTYPRLSPDGTRVALDVRDEMNDIWIWDLARQTLTRLTFDPGNNRSPVWTPDGRRIAFSAARDGSENVFWQAADGTGTAERLTQGPTQQVPSAFSPDGTRLVFNQPDFGLRDLGIVSLQGERRADLILRTPFDEHNGDVSPDGRWLAYQSNESGRAEVYVRPFPDVNAGKWQVSTDGGTRPLWARSGRELFYYLPPGTLMAVPIQPESGFAAGTPQVVFKGAYLAPANGRTYDVSPDGQRFLMIKDAQPAGEAPPPPQLIVVQNWFEELKRLVPVR